MKKKRALTLIEMLIALSLLTLLLSSLFFWYHHMEVKKHQADTLLSTLKEELYADQQLLHFFSRVTAPCYAKPQEMVCLWDRGVYKEPLLAGKVLARLQYDPSLQALLLDIWPDPFRKNPAEPEIQQSPHQRIFLLEGISHLAFSYYQPPKPSLKGQFLSVWERNPEETPCMVRVTVTRAESSALPARTLTLCYNLSSSPIFLPEA